MYSNKTERKYKNNVLKRVSSFSSESRHRQTYRAVSIDKSFTRLRTCFGFNFSTDIIQYLTFNSTPANSLQASPLCGNFPRFCCCRRYRSFRNRIGDGKENKERLSDKGNVLKRY